MTARSRSCWTPRKHFEVLKPLPGGSCLDSADHQIGDACRICASFHIVRANDMRAFQNKRCLGCQSSEQPVSDTSIFAIASQRPPDKRFTRDSSQQGISELVKIIKVFQQGIILLVVLAEAETWIEHNAVP